MNVTISGALTTKGGAPLLLERADDHMGLTDEEITAGLGRFYGWRCGGCRQSAYMPAELTPEEAEGAARRGAESHSAACVSPYENV
ncbi:hypothetical protein [Streptomyces abikoensis]|uniref:hypothetical protein n=1 Tax=Streptomyces abikoensis TaxID=97398 RepID=UPI00167BDEFD|nr:hypothetical protein [Streptomyces abikoensis]GGP55910.1 hypothetical protein GCM10010214_31380 [Streptomyces abikoensis]